MSASLKRCVRVQMIVVLLISGLLIPSPSTGQAAGPTNEPIIWQVIKSSDDHLRLDIHIYDDDVSLNGHGVLLGVPSLAGLSLHILSQEMTILPPSPVNNRSDDIAPMAAGMRSAPAQPFRQDTTAPVEIDESGLLRDQQYVLLRVYPRLYDAAHDLDRFYTYLQIELRWQFQGRQHAFSSRAAGGPFESVLAQTLHNYADLERPQTSVTPQAAIEEPSGYWPVPEIGVVEDGLYMLTYADLVTIGAELDYVDPADLFLTLDGVEQSIWIQDGDDGSLDPGDTLYFYGIARNDLYTGANVYVLNHGRPGLRMTTRTLASISATPPALSFPTMRHFEVNNHYWQRMPGGIGQDRWFWDKRINAGDSLTVTLDVPSIAQVDHNVTMQIMLQGRSSNTANADRHTQIILNGTVIDSQTWAGEVPFSHTVTLPHTLLSSGDNTLIVHNMDVSNPNTIFLDWISLDYRRTYTAKGDVLTMTPPPGAYQFNIEAFIDPSLILLDVTDPVVPVRLLGAETVTIPQGQAGFTHGMRFADTVQPGARYLAASHVGIRRPAWMVIDNFSEWRSRAHGADSILITHADFITPTRRLADFHRSRGLRTVVVDVEDIYDEFSYSRFTPEAIRDFLAYAYANWQAPAPTYVTLIGDATIDYRDRLGTGTRNFVPTALTQTADLGDTPTDNWFVTVSGDDPLPDLFIGRLSVDSADQAEAVIDKIIGYTAPSAPTIGRSILMVIDDDDGNTFPIATQQLMAVLPVDLLVDTIDTAQSSLHAPPRSAIVDALTQGRAFVHYNGHGSVNSWGTWQDERIFTSEDVALIPTDAPPVLVTVANCFNGYFAWHNRLISLAEAFQRRPESGAIAVWAPTGLSYPAGHLELMKSFYATFLGNGEPGPTNSLGAAAAAAKITVYTQGVFWTELVETYTLFGDPSQRLVLPAYPFQSYLPQVQGND